MYSLNTVLWCLYNVNATSNQPLFNLNTVLFFLKDLGKISQSGLVGLTDFNSSRKHLEFPLWCSPIIKDLLLLWYCVISFSLLCKSTKYILSFLLNINETANALYILICYHILCLHFNMYSCPWSISLLSIIIDVIGFFPPSFIVFIVFPPSTTTPVRCIFQVCTCYKEYVMLCIIEPLLNTFWNQKTKIYNQTIRQVLVNKLKTHLQ